MSMIDLKLTQHEAKLNDLFDRSSNK